MKPLLFVNWRQVSSRFTALMWLVACILAVVVLVHVPGSNVPARAWARVPGTGAPYLATVPARSRH